MLVSFKFECMKHGEFEHWFNTAQYPDRNFPFNTVMCPEKECNRLSQVRHSSNMSPDNYWAGRRVESLGLNNVTSRDYLRRYLKTEGISQLTSDEVDGHRFSQKTNKQRVEEYLNKPEVERKRRDKLAEGLEKSGLT